MITTKKIIASATLALAMLGLTTSLPAFADGASDAAMYCVGCHDGLTVNGVIIGGGARSCPQRTASEWTTTIERMNGKGCSVPAGSIAGMASYLAGLGSTPTTSTSSSTSSSTTSTTTSTTIGGTLLVCYFGVSDGRGTYVKDYTCPPGSTSSTPICYPQYLIFATETNWFCGGAPITTTSTTSTSSSSTTSSTTSTTLCNTYVNGTTQYPYSGSGSCHGHSDNDASSGHVVRDEKWCRKHMTHFNSSGNHVHAYPHPACM